MRFLERAKVMMVSAIVLMLMLLMGVTPPPALALTQVKIFDLSYEGCPSELAEGNVTSMNVEAANCFLIKGKTENSSGKYVIDADVFGRIYDANGNPVMQNRSRVGTIPEIPPGESPFEIRISVAADQPTPLQLKQFKASGFTARVRPYYYSDWEGN